MLGADLDRLRRLPGFAVEPEYFLALAAVVGLAHTIIAAAALASDLPARAQPLLGLRQRGEGPPGIVARQGGGEISRNQLDDVEPDQVDEAIQRGTGQSNRRAQKRINRFDAKSASAVPGRQMQAGKDEEQPDAVADEIRRVLRLDDPFAEFAAQERGRCRRAPPAACRRR